MNGVAVRHVITVVTTTDTDVEGCSARAAQANEIATQTAAAKRAGRTGHGSRSQRWPGELT